MTELRTRLRELTTAALVVVVLSLLAVTIIALRLIWVGWDIAGGIITAAQPDALANDWLVVATAFVVGVAPLIALAAAVGRVFAGGNAGHPRSTTEDENNTGGQSNPARAPSRPSLFESESAGGVRHCHCCHSAAFRAPQRHPRRIPRDPGGNGGWCDSRRRALHPPKAASDVIRRRCTLCSFRVAEPTNGEVLAPRKSEKVPKERPKTPTYYS
jgi:hypothetical protein